MMGLLPLAITRAWAQAGRAFNRRERRERVLMICAAAVVTLWLCGLGWLEGRWLHMVQQRQQAAGAANALSTLQDDAARMHALHQIKLQQARAELLQLREQLRVGMATTVAATATAASTSATVWPAVAGLVAPQQMLALLQDLLGRQHGLRLRSLQSLGQTALNDTGLPLAPGQNLPAGAPTPALTAAGRSPGATTATGTSTGPSLYRHTVELGVEGSYADLLAYLQALEALPHKLLWGPLKLDVERHPNVLLKLEVYTLSPQTAWVEL
jgi:MSHA biogenesis protein MshJ